VYWIVVEIGPLKEELVGCFGHFPCDHKGSRMVLVSYLEVDLKRAVIVNTHPSRVREGHSQKSVEPHGRRDKGKYCTPPGTPLPEGAFWSRRPCLRTAFLTSGGFLPRKIKNMMPSSGNVLNFIK